jgi:alkanesulfonate monooxygenase SsuD/methylene tetrahydromethanopterin reductase-like flavin-dependent oxidoreductase (luciferase family)
MKFGFIPIEGGSYYPEFLAEALLGEALGFDSVWLEEHHGIREHYWPSPMVGLAGIAARTERILLGTDIIVLPFYHPVRVAEDAAMLDIMSAGRFILGAAIGYKPDEFALYQVPMEKRGARFEEAIQLIRLLWTAEEVDFSGQYYQVRNLKIEPRPAHHLPIWLGGWGELSLERAARLADAWLPGPTADLTKLLDAQSSYFGKLEGIGVDGASRPRPLTREAVIAGTDAAAREMAEEHLMISYRDEYGGGTWKHPLIGAEDAAPVNQFDALSRDRFLVGSPETVISQIQHFRESFGVDHLIFRLYFPGLPHAFIMDEIRLLAKEVLPAFRQVTA